MNHRQLPDGYRAAEAVLPRTGYGIGIDYNPDSLLGRATDYGIRVMDGVAGYVDGILDHYLFAAGGEGGKRQARRKRNKPSKHNRRNVRGIRAQQRKIAGTGKKKKITGGYDTSVTQQTGLGKSGRTTFGGSKPKRPDLYR